jgi:DNA-binding response OmpR family regulator
MSKKHIVLVEDETDMADLVVRRLTREGYQVDVARDGLTGLDLIRSRLPDLALVDIMLPRMSGTDLVTQMRQDPRTAGIPVVMMTAKGEESDIILGLHLGADDYIVKPLSLSVLVARVAAVLRRAQAKEPGKGVLKVGAIMIDNEVITLTLTEFRLLAALAGSRGRVLTRSQLIDHAMGVNTVVTDRTIDVHMTSLRKKLGDARDYLQTVRGIGYRLVSEDEQDDERE